MPANVRSRLELFGRLRRIAGPVRNMVPEPLRAMARRFVLGEDTRPSMDVMYVDVVGTCNLRCPSCPVGNTRPTSGKGLMDVDTFRAIMAKATSEYRIGSVGLFNWTEPMIHPRLPELVRIVHEHGLACTLSSNLNLLRDPDAVLAEAPEQFRVSLSGFTQENYGATHAAGDIEKVKKNMRLLAESKQRVGNTTTDIQVYYHRYLRNLDELPAMKDYASSLGFSWIAGWAYLMPMEKVLALAEGRLPEADVRFMESEFALPIPEALAAARSARDAPCSLFRKQLVLDVNGDVAICCTVYDSEAKKLGKFLDMSVADFMRVTERHPTCDECMSHGIHRYATYPEDPELLRTYDRLAAENIARRSGQRTRSLPIVA